MRYDWILSPLQIVETLKAKACGAPLVLQVLRQGTAAMAKFAAPSGMDLIYEVVNVEDVAAADAFGAVLYGINLSIGLKLAGIPGAKEQTMQGLMNSLPQGVFSVVGAESLEEMRFAKYAGADAIFLKHSAFQNDPQLRGK